MVKYIERVLKKQSSASKKIVKTRFVNNFIPSVYFLRITYELAKYIYDYLILVAKLEVEINLIYNQLSCLTNVI